MRIKSEGNKGKENIEKKQLSITFYTLMQQVTNIKIIYQHKQLLFQTI